MNFDFVYNGTNINKNKLKRNWIEKNKPELYKKLLEFEKDLKFKPLRYSQILYHYSVQKYDVPVCEHCGEKNYRFVGFDFGYMSGCNKHCAILLSRPSGIKTREKNTLKKYGVKHTSQLESVKKKMEKTNLKKYGKKAPAQNKEIKEKIISTNIEKYGCEFPLQNEEIKNKLIRYFINTYGVNNPIKTKEVKEKIKQTSLKKYGVEWHISSDEVKNKIQKTMLSRYGVTSNFYFDEFVDHSKKVKKEKYGENYQSELTRIGKRKKLYEYYKNLYDDFINYDSKSGLLKMECNICGSYEIEPYLLHLRKREGIKSCLTCNPLNNRISNGHQEIIDFLKNDLKILNIEVNTRKIINPLELDIYLPDLKIAIEYNGLYWHSEFIKGKYYHIEKHRKCKKLNIDIINIWEDDWKYKKDIIKSILKNRIGGNKKIWARKCDILEVNNTEAKEFLNNNHIQGWSASKYRYGLYYKGELVSLMTFSNRRIIKNNGTEMVRFCNKLGLSVVGSASKLFKYFINNNDVKCVVSYSDNDFFNGNLYLDLGMKLEKDYISNYYWSDGNKKYNRWNFRKSKLIEEGFDPNKTENQIMIDRGWVRCFGSGVKKFTIELN